LPDQRPDGPYDYGRSGGHSAALANCGMGPTGRDASSFNCDVLSLHGASISRCDVPGSDRDVPGSDPDASMSDCGMSGSNRATSA
jgi:hypothetical protein